MEQSIRPKISLYDAQFLVTALRLAVNFGGLDKEFTERHADVATAFADRLEESVHLHFARKELRDLKSKPEL